MWNIIKAEYLHTFTNLNIKIIPYSIIYILLFYTSEIKSELLLFYVFAGGIILTLYNDNRFYLFSNLPIANKKIAFIRLQMLGLNFAVLLIVIIPILLIQENAFENLLKLFATVGIFISIRLFSFSLFDISSGFNSRKKKFHLTLLLLFGILIIIAYSYILTIYFQESRMVETFIYLSVFLVSILSYISTKTFLAKEKITVREK